MSRFAYLIAFGGNLGDRELNAFASLELLKQIGTVGRQSAWHLTPPLRSDEFEVIDHEDYLNFVFEFFSDFEPDDLYLKIKSIEDSLGHDRSQRWRPRAVDLDILFMAEGSASSENFDPSRLISYESSDGSLKVPHSEVWKRGFLIRMIKDELSLGIVNCDTLQVGV